MNLITSGVEEGRPLELKRIEDVSEGLKQSSLSYDLTVFSGAKIKHYPESKFRVGEIVEMNPFLSTTVDYYKAWDKSKGKDTILHIDLPKGANAGYVGVEEFNRHNYKEREITINKNQKYEVQERGKCIFNGEEYNFLHLKLIL